MNEDLITRWERVRVDAVIVLERQREVSGEHVGNLVTSYEEFGGQLQPILVDEAMVLIDGAHRLEAAKVAGYEWVDAGIVRGNLTPEERAYAEASANAVRRELTVREQKLLHDTVFKPRLEREARERQRLAAEQTNAHRWGSVASENFSEATDSDPSERASVASQARALVGISAVTMRKLDELEELASSDNEAIARVANHALERIDKSGQVDGEYKIALKFAEKAAAPPKSDEQVQAENANAILKRLVDQVTFTEERFKEVGPEGLLAAVRADAAGTEELDGMLASLDRQIEFVQSVRRGGLRAVNQ